MDWYTCYYNSQSTAVQAGLGPPAVPAPPPVAPAPPAAPPKTTPPPADTGTGKKTPSSPGSKPTSLFDGTDFFGEGGGGGSLDDYCSEFPDDPLCQVWYYGGIGTVSTGGGFGGDYTVVVQNTGLSAVDVNSIVNSSLSGLWASTVNWFDLALAGFASGILTALTALGNALKAVYNLLSRMAGLILNLLKTLLLDIVKSIIAALGELKQLLKDLYDDVLKPLIGAVQELRKSLIDLWTKYIRPLVLIIQHIRQILAILKLFHIGFAAKLDAALADIQAKITGPFLVLLSYVNGIANWMNLIVTANYLLQKPIFLASLNAYKGEAINLQLNAMTQPISAAGAAAIAAQASIQPAAKSAADLNTFLTNSSGPIATDFTKYDAVFQAALQGQVQESAA